MTGPAADVIVVGGGHNGLICAAYLARTGIDTLLVEARPSVGGCASTVSDLGARFNICHCDHTMIRATPVVEELELGRHGLRYLEAEATNVHLFHDGGPAWVQYTDSERTLDGLARTHPGQVDAYRRYLAEALPVARLLLDLVNTTPSTVALSATAARRHPDVALRLLRWSRRSMTDVLGRHFDDWRFVTPAASLGPTVWGVPPDRPGTGMAALVYATRHLVRTGRAEGGSGALTDAVRGALEAAGGVVRCDAPVASVLVEGGRACGVRLVDGTELRSTVVVAATDPRTVLVDWLGEVPAPARRMVDRWRAMPVPDGYEAKIDAVLTAAPRFRGQTELEAAHPGVDLAAPTALVNPDPDDLARAHRLRVEGRVAERPTLLVNAPSVLDPSMAPAPGHHVLSLEVLFTPWGLVGGWEGSSEPDRWLDLWADLAEVDDARATVDRWRVMTPDRYQRELNLERGHTPAYAGSPLATLLGRHPELSRYRTALPDLYLSGAGTYPGAGIFGAAGRHAAVVVARRLLGRRAGRPTPHRRKRGPGVR